MNVYPSRSIRTSNLKLIYNAHPEYAFTTHIDLLVRETSGDYFKQWQEQAKTDSKAAAVLARYHGRPEFELFDLSSDPLEQTNLADLSEMADTKAELLSVLKGG